MKASHSLLRLAALLGLLLGLWACQSSSDGGGGSKVDSQTHWLEPCQSDADCGDRYSCLCGVCTLPCQEAGQSCQDTGSPSLCFPQDGGALHALCGGLSTPSSEGLCLPQCQEAGDCAQGQLCQEGACVPEPAQPPTCQVQVAQEEQIADQSNLAELMLTCSQALEACDDTHWPSLQVTALDEGQWSVTCGCFCEPEPEGELLACDDGGQPFLRGDYGSPQEQEVMASWCVQQQDRCPEGPQLQISSQDGALSCGCQCDQALCQEGDYTTIQEFGLFPGEEPELYEEFSFQCEELGDQLCPEGHQAQLRADSAQGESELSLFCDCLCQSEEASCPSAPAPPLDRCEGRAVEPLFDRSGCLVAWSCRQVVCEPVDPPNCPDGTQLTASHDDQGCVQSYQCVQEQELEFLCGEQMELCIAPRQYCALEHAGVPDPEGNGPQGRCEELDEACQSNYSCDCFYDFWQQQQMEDIEVDCEEQDGMRVNLYFP